MKVEVVMLLVLSVLAKPGFGMEREPRIALALGAGAARGLAHIGVLKALEENGIEVDYIAGTSMGAVIGSLYAAGYSAAQIEEIVRSIHWQEIFSGRPERPLVPLAQRVDMTPPIVRVGLDRWDIRLPQAIASDYRINRLLTEFLAGPGFKAQRDFDQLPIPFRAVAADLATGERVILSQGSLDRAVRSSMATPVRLLPVRQGERLLVDGGVVDHLPVGVVREMGADRVIGVDVRMDPLPAEEYRDALGVAIQLVDVLARARNQSFANPADVTIKPDLEGIRYEDYKDFEQIIALGYQAATREMEPIRRLLDPDSRDPSSRVEHVGGGGGSDQTANAAGGAGAELERRTIAEIRVEENRCVLDQHIRDVFGQDPGRPFDFAQALRGMDALHATRLFETLWLDLEPRGSEEVTVVVHAPEAWRQTIELGAAYNEADQVSGFLRLRNRNLFGSGEDFDMTLRASDSELAAVSQLAGDRLIGEIAGYYVRASIVEEKPRFFRDGEFVGRAEFDRLELGGGLQRQIGPAALLRAGASLGRVHTRDRQGVDFPEARDRVMTLDGLAVWDNLNDRSLPTRGEALSLAAEKSLTDWGASLDYWRAVARGRFAFSLGKRSLLEGQLEAGESGGDLPVYEFHRIGGPALMPGFDRNELWGPHALAGAIAPSLFITEGLRLTASVGAGNVWDTRSEFTWSSLQAGFGLALRQSTRFGPIALGWGGSDSRDSRVYFSAGFEGFD